MWIAASVAALLLVVVGVAIQVGTDARDSKQAAMVAAESEKSRAEQAAKDQARSDAADATRRAKLADQARAKKAQADEDKAERALRKETVSGIEKSVKKMAKKHVRDDVIAGGPIISVSCDPVAGGSVENLDEKTTAFQCFAANKDNKDGTLSGFYYHATMNWGTGSYTYGLGES